MAEMNLDDLILRLEDLREEYGPDLPCLVGEVEPGEEISVARAADLDGDGEIVILLES